MSDPMTPAQIGQRNLPGLAAFRKIVMAVGRQIDSPARLHETIVAGACELVSARHAALVLVEPQTRGLELAAAAGADWRTESPARELALTEGIAGKVLATGLPCLCPNTQTEPDYYPLFALAAAEVAVPLHSPGRLLGILVVASEQFNAFNQGHAALLSPFADHAAVALENACRYAAVQSDNKAWQSLFKLMPDGLIVCDENLEVQRVNTAFLKMVGRTLRNVLDCSVEDVFYRLSIFGSQTRFWESLRRHGRAEQKFRSTSGRRGFHIHAVRASVKEQPAYLVVLRETTHQDDLQEKVRQSDALLSLGQVLGRWANELNNPLQTVAGYAEVLLKHPGRAKSGKQLKLIHQASQRSARLVKSLLLQAHRLAPQFSELSANALVEDTVREWQNAWLPPTVRLQLEVLAQDARLLGDRFQLEQALQHLLHHARQALLSGPPAQGACIRVALHEVRDQVRLTLAHNGCALPSHRRQRIFEPSLATRNDSNETGLELCTCHHIVQLHGGRIGCESSSGAGTAFFIELPVLGGSLAAVPLDSPALHSSPGRILIVDDEPAVGDLLQEILHSENIPADVAGDAGEALGLLEKKSYGLILCDLKMPGMSGKEFYFHLRKSRPALARRVLFTTGAVQAEHAELFPENHGHTVLLKPFKTEQLLQRMAAHLARLPDAA